MATRPPPDEMITPPLHDAETTTVPHDTTMTATTRPDTETETVETETVKNDNIAIQKNLLTIEVLIVTVVEITLPPAVDITVQTEVRVEDLLVEEITVPVEVMGMITLRHGIENLGMIVGGVDQIDLMVLEEVEDIIAVDLEEETGNGVHLLNDLVDQLQI